MDQAENVGTLTRWVVDVPLPGNEKYPGTPVSQKHGGPRRTTSHRGPTPLRPDDAPVSNGPTPSSSSSSPSLQPPASSLQPARGDRPGPCVPCVPHECHSCVPPPGDDSILASPSSLPDSQPSSLLGAAAPGPCGPRSRAERKRRPRIIDTLAQARHFQHLIDSGQVKNAAQLARNLNLTRARISQILSLLRLAPEILDYIDNLNGDEGQMFLTAKMLLPLAKMPRKEQVGRFEHHKSLRKTSNQATTCTSSSRQR